MEFNDVRENIDDDISLNKNRGFKPSRKMYRRVFNKHEKRSRSIDKFGDPYFFDEPDDKTKVISVTLPKSMIVEVDNYCKEKNITRSRLVRKVLEYSLNLGKD